MRPLALARVDTETAGVVRGIRRGVAGHRPGERRAGARGVERRRGPLAAPFAEGVELPVSVVGLGGRENSVACVSVRGGQDVTTIIRELVRLFCGEADVDKIPD